MHSIYGGFGINDRSGNVSDSITLHARLIIYKRHAQKLLQKIKAPAGVEIPLEAL